MPRESIDDSQAKCLYCRRGFRLQAHIHLKKFRINSLVNELCREMKYQPSLLPLSYHLLLFFRRRGLNSLCFPLLQLINKGEANKPEFEAFKGSGKTLRQKRKN